MAGILYVALTHSTQYLSYDLDFVKLLDRSDTALIHFKVLRLGLYLFLYNIIFSIITTYSTLSPSISY